MWLALISFVDLNINDGGKKACQPKSHRSNSDKPPTAVLLLSLPGVKTESEGARDHFHYLPETQAPFLPNSKETWCSGNLGQRSGEHLRDSAEKYKFPGL